MALTIQGSDYAYDKNGLEEALKNIKASIIDDAANKVSEGIDNIIGSVEQYWVGSGAEMFKKNLESDKKYQTESEQNQTDINISKLNSLINSSNSTIENTTKSIKELEEKIKKLEEKRKDF